MTHIKFPAKGVLTIRYWRNGALIERAWQQSQPLLDWEPCDPQIVKVVGMKNGLVRVFEGGHLEV